MNFDKGNPSLVDLVIINVIIKPLCILNVHMFVLSMHTCFTLCGCLDTLLSNQEIRK